MVVEQELRLFDILDAFSMHLHAHALSQRDDSAHNRHIVIVTG